MTERPRRLRQSRAVRDLVAEHSLDAKNFVYPLFLQDSSVKLAPIKSLPGINRFNNESILGELEEAISVGVKSFALFPKVDENLKDAKSSFALKSENFYLNSIAKIKKHFPDVCLFSDVACDPYSSDGHDGFVDPNTGAILNDESLVILSEMALKQAQAGIDFVAPSDMMDGRVKSIRDMLDKHQYTSVGIMSYCVKYASHFYGPFREALDSAPKAGDKKTYQMDFRNSKDIYREARLDQEEGADILMVKPGLPYLDILYRLSEFSDLPLSVYQVSGEYAMLKALALQGLAKESDLVLESLMSFRRAGAQMIFTYYAKEAAKWIKNS
ncbi:MAG: porphobilinogen synthase [Bacteriovoracaceae bacterium]|nr:porphobilinogen synthase [Bacteriovoracaceae bacterium]